MSIVAPEFIAQVPLIEALRRFELFAGVPDEQLNWFARHASDQTFAAGEQLVHEGDEADSMTLIIEGQLRYQTSEPGSPVFIARTGTATGLLPFSRLTRYPGSAFAITPLRVARIFRDDFPAMLQAIPLLGPRLVAVMSDRIRERTRILEQREKLIALGKLAAGLAHELNNPASAAQRAAEDLRRWILLLRDSNQALADAGFEASQFRCLLDFERETIENSGGQPLDSLERSDREEGLARWLAQHGVKRANDFAPLFVEAGIDEAQLAEIQACSAPEIAEHALSRIAAALAIDRLTTGIQASTGQISDLVRAVKGYSFLDQAPEQDLDIVCGIDDTLQMFGHRLRHGVVVSRDYQPDLPRISAHGSELNQVWTQLIDNALDSMGDSGTLGIRVACEARMLLVEVTDTGKGIPPEVKDRIFDPFFTTKDVGAGRGLGLDIAFRIVQKHRGDIRFTSQPGETSFQVRLPIQDVSTF
jgi:signal transduction histidine kinase